MSWKITPKGVVLKLGSTSTEDIPTFDSTETAEMLAIFVEGFERAEARLKDVDIPNKRQETEVVVDISNISYGISDFARHLILSRAL